MMKTLDYPFMLIARTLLLALYICALPFVLLYIGLTPQSPGRLRYAAYLLVNFAFDVLANLIAPILPLFAKPSLGQSNNGIETLVEPRLPSWLSWFMTPDNSLYGDKGWQTIHYPNYKSYTGQWLWLVRNNAHGLVNGPLAARFNSLSDIKHEGNPWLHKNNHEHVGQKFYATCGNYFQYMTVRKIPTINRAIFFNIGWQFDPFIEDSNTKNAYVAALKFSIKIGAKV